ncbi:hypothetical protein Pssp01_26110 [Pseudomonas sp. NBRC 100443]|nr:hypothetical protein Pssp01_26110 [Pseudomonas sp. NBRC 100443]
MLRVRSWTFFGDILKKPRTAKESGNRLLREPNSQTVEKSNLTCRKSLIDKIKKIPIDIFKKSTRDYRQTTKKATTEVVAYFR